MGGGGHDWQDRELEDEERAKDYYTNHICSLDTFSDAQLEAELRKRADDRLLKELQRVQRLEHNAPLQMEIEKLEKQIYNLKSQLK